MLNNIFKKIVSKKNTSLILLLILLITGCATKYQPLGFSGGYQDMSLSKDIYIVSFGGNSLTSQSTVEKYLLRRCSEITLQKGYKYFVVINGRTNVAYQTITTPTTVHTSSNSKDVFGNTTSYSTINYGHSETLSQFDRVVTIKLLKDNKKYTNAFDAVRIFDSFQSK